MKPNRFQQVLGEGKVPVGHMIVEFGTRGIAQIVEAANLDFVIIDMEHGSFTQAEAADLIAWFKATTIAPFVRIPQIDRHFVARLMDAGALGIMAPDVESAAAAQTLVDAAKYPPLGRRGPTVGLANTDFKPVTSAEFMPYSNANTTIICQIESQAGLDNLEAIAATPGLDVLWVGQNDLSQSLGITGQFQHERFLAALRQVVGAAKRHHLAVGVQPRDLKQAQEWLAMGFNVLSFSSDLNVYRETLTKAVADLRALIGG